MKRSYPKILRNRKRRIQRRLDPERGWSDQAKPIMRAGNIHYEMAEKSRAVNCGGIGAIHTMINKLGLRQEIESRLHLESMLPAPEDPLRLSPLLRGPSGQVLEAVRNLGLEGVVGKRSIPPTNPASDQARGSSTARTWSRSSSSAVTFPALAALMHCVGVYENKKLILVTKVKNGFVPRMRDDLITDSRSNRS